MNPSDPFDPLKKFRIIKGNNCDYKNLDNVLRVGELLTKEEFKTRFLEKGWRPKTEVDKEFKIGLFEASTKASLEE